MSEITGILSAVLAGVLLGVLFFGGLWWTVRKTLSSTQAGLWFSGSFLVRTAVVLVGFYFVGQGDWRRITGCIAGFLGARLCVVRATRLKEGS
jgi:F1F0 ATPase subunit 2